jgi:large subunit ribosomal protein L6
MIKIFYKKIVYKSIISVLKLKNNLYIKGPLGLVSLNIPNSVSIKQSLNTLYIFGNFELKDLIKTVYTLIHQKLKGVELGFFEILLIKGIGWRVNSEKSGELIFNLGFSHTILYKVLKGVEFFILDKQAIRLFGLDLELVQQVAADLCLLKIIDIYKGKGIYRQLSSLKLKSSSKSKA